MKPFARTWPVRSPLVVPSISLGTSVARLVHPITGWFLKSTSATDNRRKHSTALPLSRGEVRQIVRGDQVDEIHVVTGVVWLTATPGDGDIVLRAADSFRLPGSGPIVIEALQDASVQLVRTPQHQCEAV